MPPSPSNKIRVKCSCGKQINVSPKYIGRRVKCPSCEAPITIKQPGVEHSESRNIETDNVAAKDTKPSLIKQKSSSFSFAFGGGIILLLVAIVFIFYLLGKESENKTQHQLAENHNTRSQNTQQAEINPVVPNSNSSEANTIVSTPLSKPESAVQGYLAARTWQERLPYVMNADHVRPKMAQVYRGLPTFNLDDFLPGTILSVSDPLVPVGGNCIVAVDISKSSPDIQQISYVVTHSPEGFKVDWEASQKHAEKEIKEALQTKWMKINPEIDVEILRWKQELSYASIEFRLTNKSTSLLPYIAVNMSIENNKGDYLGSAYTNETNVRSGGTIVKEITFNNVEIGEVASWKMELKEVHVDLGDGQEIDLTPFFKMNEKLAGAAKGYQPKLESCLIGQWRHSNLHYFFSSEKPEVIFLDDKETVLKNGYKVVERNYSTGKFKIRLFPEKGYPYQCTFTIMDSKKVSFQITHKAFKSLPSLQVMEEINKPLEEWTYVNEQETP